MVGTKVLVRLALVASALGVVFAGTAEARDLKVVKRKVAAATVAAPAPVEAPVVKVAARPDIVATVSAVPPCARKVKVIYAGYGEADRASCTLASAEVASASLVTR